MAILLIQHHVKDFAEWKKVFDSFADTRKSFGELSTQIFRGADPSGVHPNYPFRLSTSSITRPWTSVKRRSSPLW